MTIKFNSMPLWAKLVLAAFSASTYSFLEMLADWIESFGTIFENGDAASHLVGIAFGALVMAPYVSSSSRRVLRIVAICIASDAIYYGAVRFVVDGPLNYNTVVPFLISGGGAALLVGLTIALLAPRRLRWILIPLTLGAGATGGLALEAIFDSSSFGAYFAWQGLVCLALHYSFREAPT